jgi:predicted ATPase
LWRLRGELLHREGVPIAEVESAFQQALVVAHSKQALSLELRAALSLARLWQEQGKERQAHELIAPIYGRFTEGFATPELLEAKALLEEFA